jgi:hypothetical protein
LDEADRLDGFFEVGEVAKVCPLPVGYVDAVDRDDLW